jgi:hypothetical protein
MASLPNSWRSLLSQQAVTTGRGITPQQAAALRQGELEANYNISGLAQDRALAAKYQADQMALAKENQGIQASQFEKSLAARQAEWEGSMGMQESGLELQGKTAEEQARIARDTLQANIDQNREANRLNKEAIDKQSSAATTSGYVQMASALPLAYMVGKNLLGKQAVDTEDNQGYSGSGGTLSESYIPYENPSSYLDLYNTPGGTYDPSLYYDTSFPTWDLNNYDFGTTAAYDLLGAAAGGGYDAWAGEAFDWGSMLFDFM